ncbi:hypothetical protein CBR_g12124 [Chara braunii]|uniref:Integrase catalytic domain-containing protein n=1 Tax=Chara braunii TaxID=69332 RepID=A0A388KR63_CHABU|nr:hypothetical protein CBR_g12124 [Chara braunii]|eukprot:GBG72554.1 hypothetical protein CBR_g12124 [Chara braunii]
MEKEEEILRIIRERRAAEGHWIHDEVADTMKIGVDGFLTVEETQLIRKACQEFHLAFAFNDHQKGRLDAKLISPVRIHTVEHECWNDKGSAYEFGIAAEVAELLRAKIDSFVAEPTASPYANKWFVFRKPNKSLRWIQDLQKLNAVTIRDAGSLPQADLLAESHVGRSIYSLIDLYLGYDQLPLDARDRPYTAMHTPVGQLQMQVTLMGFTNAVADAQRRMLAVAGDMFPEKCEPYIDDNPIKGAQNKDETEVQSGIRKFVWDHLQDIKDLLQRFLVYNITASGPKSILAVPEVTLRCAPQRKEVQYLVNQAQEKQDTKQEGQKFFLVQMYDGVFREIGLLLIENKQPMEVSLKAREEAERYVLRNDHLFKREEGMMPRRVVCGRSRQLDIIQAMHDGLTGGHRSSKGTLAKIVPFYFWPGMAGKVTTYCQTCLICQERSFARVFEPLRPTQILGPGHLVHLDLAVMPVSVDGYRYILDARDNLSGYVEAVALKRKTGKGVADRIEDFYLRHPFVRRFIADNGTEFVNHEVLSRLKTLPSGEQGARQAGEPSTRKRKLYVGFDFNVVVGRGGRKQGTKGPSPLRKGEPIDLPSDSDNGKGENGSPRKKQRMDEEEPNEVIDLSSGEEDDEVTTPTKEVWARDEDPVDEKDKWIKEFGSSCSDWFDQWSSIMRYEWAIKGKEKLSRGEDKAPTTFFTEEALRERREGCSKKSTITQERLNTGQLGNRGTIDITKNS